MQPTYNRPAQPASAPANPWQLGPTASKIARWVFGLGFFSLHLGIFLIAGLTLLMINLYRSPDDLWVGGPLLRWGIVVVIHGLGAVVTWAITTAIDAAEETRRETARYEPPQPTPAMPVQPVVPRITQAPALVPPRPRFQPGHSTPVEASQAGDVRGSGHRAWRDTPAEPAIHRPSPPGWTVMRPGEPVPHAPAPAAAGADTHLWTPPADVPAATPVPPSASGAADDDLAATEDNRWTWVEAAAEAWLSKRPEKPAGKPGSTEETPS
jgi:hypothetical protein